MKTVSKRSEEDVSPPPIKVQDVRAARTLASDITQIGAKLYDLMESETQERVERARALRFLDQVASSAGAYELVGVVIAWITLVLALLM